jgi:hypothetical protein
MSKANEWDRDIAILNKEVSDLLRSHRPTHDHGARGLILRKVKLIQGEIDCDRNVERLVAHSARDYLLLPRERAFLHWTRIFLEQVGKLRALRSEVASRGLWLGLLQTRLLGTKVTAGLGASELMEMSIRRANLLKTEKYLAELLVKLKARRLELVRRYETLPIADANQLASQSLSYRLGKDLEDALQSPILSILGQYLITRTYPVIAPEQTAKVRKLEEKFKRDERLIKARVVGDRKGLTSDKFERALKQLDDLQRDTLAAYQELQSRSPQSPVAQIL